MKTTSYKVSAALKDVWRWREALIEGVAQKSVEEQLRIIAKRGDMAAQAFGFEISEPTRTCVAETTATYGVPDGRN